MKVFLETEQEREMVEEGLYLCCLGGGVSGSIHTSMNGVFVKGYIAMTPLWPSVFPGVRPTYLLLLSLCSGPRMHEESPVHPLSYRDASGPSRTPSMNRKASRVPVYPHDLHHHPSTATRVSNLKQAPSSRLDQYRPTYYLQPIYAGSERKEGT